jgi:hypothetical protein
MQPVNMNTQQDTRFVNPSARSLHDLLAAGHRVIIRHYRNATVKNFVLKHVVEKEVLQVPSHMREYFDFLPCGGRTDVVIFEKNDGARISLSTTCRSNENFCYKLGVMYALKRLNDKEYQQLLK